MRLLVDARPFIDSPTGGVGRVAYHLTKAVAESFPQDEIICATTGAGNPLLPTALKNLPNVRHVHIRVPNKAWSAGCMTGLVSLDTAVEDKIGQCEAAFFPNIGFFGKPRLKHAILVHDLSFLIEPEWFTPKQRLWHAAVRAKSAIARADKVFAVSHATARDITKLIGVPAERISVLPMGMTLRTDRQIQPTPDLPARFVMALGAGDRRKNSKTAVEAVRMLRLQSSYRDLELVLIGKTDRPYIETWIRHIPSPDDAKLAALYSRAEAFLYPSWYEGYGLPLHEAASFGTPRIASTSGALPETAPAGTMFADPAKPHHWAQAIELAIKGPKQAISGNSDAWRQAAKSIVSSLR